MSGIEDVLIQQGGGDDEVEIDFSGTTGSKPLTPGWEQVRVLACVADTSAAGNKMLVFDLETVGGQRSGWKLKKWAPIEGAGAGIAKNVLKSLGEAPGDKGYRIRPGKLVGRTAECEVEYDLREDKLDDDGEPRYNSVGKFRVDQDHGGGIAL